MSSPDADRITKIRKQRCIAAVPTFFKPRGETPQPKKTGLDEDAISKQIKLMVQHGISPLIIGTTGESPTLEHDEEIALIGLARKVVDSSCPAGSVPLMVGAGSNDTDHACTYTQDAVKHGADAVLSVYPYYNKPGRDGTIEHFGLVADAAEGTPVIIYNIPARTGGNGITHDMLAELANDYPNVAGVKECNENQLTKDIIGWYPQGFTVWTGEDGKILDHMENGAVGVVSVLANVDPLITKHVVELCAAGQFELAALIFQTRQDLIKLLFAEGNPAGVKGACSLLGIGNGETRLPIAKASPKLLEALGAEMKRLGLIKTGRQSNFPPALS